MDRLEQDYFEWLCDHVMDDTSTVKYDKLMSYLYDYMFTAILDMDNNRADDGICLRYRFGMENDISEDIIRTNIDYRYNSSVLEMMVALSIRCEEGIMTDEEYGDRTGEWFWNMIVSLGLGSMNDDRFDEKYVNVVLDRLIERQYKRNGEGGLFTIDGIKKDMRNIEIWYQMCWYLDYL